ncbi:hypothetical protein HK097_000550 [Rhizophlyctis rosea]|uniref:Bystin n=1 Tax=Rhizophlyctis rosea TaxID=64517 RepID=A0AAD5SMY0_9FUNG|nr:hypothetical protein HK097_000550 [Rhizophlyctis rosea]
MPANKKKSRAQRHDPLHVQLTKDANIELGRGGKKRRTGDDGRGDSDDDASFAASGKKSEFVDSRTSRKILDIVRSQQDEIEREEGPGEQETLVAPAKRFTAGGDSDEEVEEYEEEEYEDYDAEAELDIDEAEQALIDKFMAKEPRKQVNLSDLIMQKIQAAALAGDVADEPVPPGMNEKVVEVYTKVGQLLSRYKSGSLPKTFKIIPSLADWEDILFLTHPEKWTPQAVYQATRIFVSNLKAKMAQRFFALVLLDRVRDDIAETKKLNYHLYMALKKSLYKPGAFFKGLLLPLCESGTCTLREAAIIGSVISKVSIPMLHSAAALLKLAEMEYTGANSLFIRLLLDKKYALPFRVVDALVFHFLRFKQDPREMPVLWHQSLLVFSQRYKEDMTPEQKEVLLDLIKHKTHESITPEIRRELQNSGSRDEMKEMEMDLDF